MTGSFIGMLVTPDGANVSSYVSLDLRDMWSPLKYRSWAIPGTEVRSRQAAEIPLRPGHGFAPIGKITALQRRPDGSVWCAGTVDDDVRLPDDEDTFLSVEASYDPGAVGTEITIEGAALCSRSLMIGVRPARLIRNGLDQFGKAEWRLPDWQRDMLERARRYRPYGEPVVVEGAAERDSVAADTRRSAGTLELRSAAVVDVSRPLREVDLLVVPHEVPSTIYERGRSYDEVFTVGAFATAEANPSRVKLNNAHQIESVIGKAVEIDAWSELGCIGRFRISKVAAGDEALTMLADDLVTPSAGFTVPKGGEEWRGTSSRRIRKANLHHVGLTADAAHKTAVLGLRSQHALR